MNSLFEKLANLQSKLSMPIEPMFVILTGLISVIALLSLMYFYVRTRKITVVQKALKELKEYITLSQDRFNTLVPHAHDYFNTLGADGARFFSRLRRVLDSLRERSEVVESLIRENDIDSAYSLLFSPISFTTNSLSQIIGEEHLSDLPPNRWEFTIENLFQKLGKNIALASSSSTMPKVRREGRSPTEHSLKKAGIILPENIQFPDKDEE